MDIGVRQPPVVTPRQRDAASGGDKAARPAGDDIERLAASGAGIAHCPTSNAKLGNGVAPVPELLAAGATVGLGTDSVMTNNDLDPFEEMRMAALVAKQRRRDPSVLPTAEVLRLATAGSAALSTTCWPG